MTAVRVSPERASRHRALLPADGMSEEFRAVLQTRCEQARLGVVGDLRALEQRYARAAQAAATHGVELLCAVKASTHPEVLSRAAQFGLGFDVANAPELAHARAAGPSALVSLTSPALPIAERGPLLAAFARGEIQRWHCDSIDQLDELARACPGTTVGVRVNLDGLAVPEGMPVYRSSRFGIRLDQLAVAREVAAAHGCRLRWIHIHNGSEQNDTASYVYAAEQIVAAARASGLDLESIDLGGGLLVEPTVEALGTFFAAVRHAAGPDVQVMFEPGRFWLTDCISLVTQVLGVKEIGDKVLLVLDFGTMSHLQWSEFLHIPTLGQLVPDDPRPWRISGRSCYEEDMLWPEEKVPVDRDGPIPRVGDCIVLGNVTGYSIELGCDFNGVARPPVEFLLP